MLKRNLVANYLGQGWTALMNLAFIPLYIKYLGIEAYGLIGVFAALQAWLRLLDMGLTPCLGREMARFSGGAHSTHSIRDLLRSIELVAVAVALLISVGMALGATWIAKSWLQAGSMSTDVVAQALTVMGLVTGLRLVEGVYRSAVMGLQRQVLLNTTNSLMSTLRGVGAVGILAWVSPTTKAFFLWQGAMSVATLASLASITYTTLPRGTRSARFSLAALHNVRRFAGGMMGITLLSLLLMQTDKLVLSRLLSLENFGYYALAATVAGSLFTLIAPITDAYYPKFCEEHAQEDDALLANNYHQAAQIVTVVAGSAAVVLMFFSATVLKLWTQDSELEFGSAALTSLLVAGNLLNGLMWVPYQMQLAYGWTKLTVITNSVALLIFVPLMLWIVPRYGAVGCAGIWIALNVSYCLVTIQLMHRRILRGEKWHWYLQDVMLPLFAASTVVGALKLLWPNVESAQAQIVLLSVAAICSLTASAMSASLVRKRLWGTLWTNR